MHVKRVIVLIVIVLLLTGCSDGGFLGLGSTRTPTPDLTSTQEAKYAAQTELAQIVTGTFNAQSTQARMALETTWAEAKETSVAGFIGRETALADPIYQKVQTYFDEGYIHSTEGKYEELFPFNSTWAQINWFKRERTWFSPNNFVVSSELHWESASQTPNLSNAGCGFSFRADTDTWENFYVVFLAMDGRVYLKRWLNDVGRNIANAYYGKVEISEETVALDLLVEDSDFHVFINGEHVLSASDDKLTEGALLFTIHSGTNKGFGTRCTINADLWIMD